MTVHRAGRAGTAAVDPQATGLDVPPAIVDGPQGIAGSHTHPAIGRPDG